jgi:hypothetical protein
MTAGGERFADGQKRERISHAADRDQNGVHVDFYTVGNNREAKERPRNSSQFT